jgi:hypothetical protein
VAFAQSSLSGGSEPHSQAPMTLKSRARRLASAWGRLGFTVVALLTFLVVWLWRRDPTEFVQLTNDNEVKNSNGWPTAGFRQAFIQ